VGDAPLPSAYGFDRSLVSFEGLGNRILFRNERLSDASSKLGNGPVTWVEKHESTKIYVDSALIFILENPSDPFYVHLFPNDVHDPHLPATGAIEMYKGIASSASEARFFAVLEDLDEQIGRFIGSLDEMGKLDNTIVIFTSDNGPTDWPRYYRDGEYPPGFTGGFLGRKWSLYDGGIRMPFIICWPAKIPEGITDSQTVMSAVDLMPSLIRLANLKGISDGDGEDRSQAMLGKPLTDHRPIMWEYGSAQGGSILPGHDKNVSPNLAILDKGWKLLINTDSSRAELYHIDKDPFESKNRVNDEPELARELAAKVLDWRRAYAVPLIE
jgi:arylsulfatase A-like enzyme